MCSLSLRGKKWAQVIGLITSVIFCVLFLTVVGFGFFIAYTSNSGPVSNQKCSFVKPVGGSVTYFAHRGDVRNNQENTLESIVAAIDAGYWPEFDVMPLKDAADIVIFHDQNTSRMTGESHIISRMTKAEVKQLTIQKTIDGYTYQNTAKIAFLSDVLSTICAKNNTKGFFIDFITFSSGFALDPIERPYAKNVIDTLAATTNCSKILPNVVVSAANPMLLNVINENVNAHNLKVNPMNFIFYTSMPIGVALWVKTRLFSWLGGSVVASFHRLVTEAYTEDVQKYRESGYCISSFGGNTTEMKALEPYLDAANVDLPPYPGFKLGGEGYEENPQYNKNKDNSYILLVSLFSVSAVLFIASLVFTVLLTRAVRKWSGGSNHFLKV